MNAKMVSGAHFVISRALIAVRLVKRPTVIVLPVNPGFGVKVVKKHVCCLTAWTLSVMKTMENVRLVSQDSGVITVSFCVSCHTAFMTNVTKTLVYVLNATKGFGVTSATRHVIIQIAAKYLLVQKRLGLYVFPVRRVNGDDFVKVSVMKTVAVHA